MKEERKLKDLVSIGPAMLKDFEVLEIKSVAQLARSNPNSLYNKLCKKTGHTHDVCVLDTFSAAIAQAKNPKLPFEKCQWWYWSRLRKKQLLKRKCLLDRLRIKRPRR